MVGDRYLTDVVYGNRNGMLTIRPAPLTLEGEPSTVHLVRPWTHFVKSCPFGAVPEPISSKSLVMSS